jgi:hypothetical protein
MPEARGYLLYSRDSEEVESPKTSQWLIIMTCSAYEPDLIGKAAVAAPPEDIEAMIACRSTSLSLR